MIDSSRANDTQRSGATPREWEAESDRSAQLPLLIRFPALHRVARAPFGAFPTPVTVVETLGARVPLMIKRDEMNARLLPGIEFAGGNKLRALEFLLGSVRAGDTVIALGGEGSTHVLATVALARKCGARTVAIRWPHDMNPVARRVAARAAATADEVHTVRTAGGAMLSGWVAARAPGAHCIPPGGASPLGMLGAVNAALELAAQIAAGELPVPARVVIPLGTGGTAAGLAAGFAIAGLAVRVVAVRVTPRVVANRWRLGRLARRCARFIERHTGEHVPVVGHDAMVVAHEWYGGAYGRPLTAARGAQDELEQATGLRLDDTYGAKAFAAALAIARSQDGPTLFWRTFDPRSVDDVTRP